MVYPPTGSRPRQADEHPAYTPDGARQTLHLHSSHANHHRPPVHDHNPNLSLNPNPNQGADVRGDVRSRLRHGGGDKRREDGEIRRRRSSSSSSGSSSGSGQALRAGDAGTCCSIETNEESRLTTRKTNYCFGRRRGLVKMDSRSVGDVTSRDIAAATRRTVTAI